MMKNFNPQEIKALVLDLDGTTLLPGAVLGDRTEACLKKLISQGMRVVFATGRSVESALPYCNAVGAGGAMIFFNGAVVADIPSCQVLDADLLDIEVADFGTDLARSMDVHYQIYLPAGVLKSGEKWEPLVIDREREESLAYFKHTGTPAVVMDLKKAVAGAPGCVKAMFLADGSRHEEIKEKMYAKFGGRINLIRSTPTFLEVLKAGVSKGKGLRTVMGRLGLAASQVMAFGDEENDLDMFKVAGFSAAPSSAKDTVREAAGLVFGSSAEEGLAVYLEKTFGDWVPG
ncbi:MAG: Cof-type HAD-IIB family hydrolase [Spirochaetes bacterium]|nr:Cof-type HAD-IIB family hydrolase [Spirochaetota bacterium]